MSHHDRNLSPPLLPDTTGVVPQAPDETAPGGIPDEELDRIRLGSDGGPLCD